MYLWNYLLIESDNLDPLHLGSCSEEKCRQKVPIEDFKYHSHCVLDDSHK